MTSGAAAARYARALFDVVLKDSATKLDTAQSELQAFADLFSTNEALAGVAANPAIPVARKAALAKALAPLVARGDEDTGALETRLKKASNAQLLRLQRATQTLKEKFGDRDKLIAAIGTARRKAKDKDYLAKLETYSLPQLLDLAASSQRAART